MTQKAGIEKWGNPAEEKKGRGNWKLTMFREPKLREIFFRVPLWSQSILQH